MSEENHKTESNHHCIPDLETVLRRKMGDDLILEKYTATDFLAPGENNRSLILAVDAVFSRKGKDSKSEKLHMIAKMSPLSKWQHDSLDCSDLFKKEIFMYETILPAYKKFELACGINEEDIFDMDAALYGSRLNLDFGDDYDDNALILMDNLKPRGYYMGSRYTGVDIHHSRVVIKALARFHALGIAIKTKNPEFFEVLKVRSESISTKNPDGPIKFGNTIHRLIKEDPVMAEHYDACAKALDGSKFRIMTTDTPEDPWFTIVHCDLWVTNILFHRNEESGLPDDVKFIDFQNYLIQSPLRDLCFLLGLLGDQEVSTKYIPELIDLYYKTFVFRLKMMGCDLSPYSRDKFDQQLSKSAVLEFTHIAHMLKISTRIADPNYRKSEDPSEDILSTGSDDFYARMRAFVTGYAKRGWFLGDIAGDYDGDTTLKTMCAGSIARHQNKQCRNKVMISS